MGKCPARACRSSSIGGDPSAGPSAGALLLGPRSRRGAPRVGVPGDGVSGWSTCSDATRIRRRVGCENSNRQAKAASTDPAKARHGLWVSVGLRAKGRGRPATSLSRPEPHQTTANGSLASSSARTCRRSRCCTACSGRPLAGTSLRWNRSPRQLRVQHSAPRSAHAGLTARLRCACSARGTA